MLIPVDVPMTLSPSFASEASRPMAYATILSSPRKAVYRYLPSGLTQESAATALTPVFTPGSVAAVAFSSVRPEVGLTE